MIADVLKVYGVEVAQHKKTARSISYHIDSLIKWWTGTVADISVKTCRAFAATRPKMAAWADIGTLRAAVNHWHENHGPLLVQPVFWQPEANPPKDRWLTRAEAARLVRAARPYPGLRRMILLGLYTGSRPGVLLSLRWGQVDLIDGVLFRVPQGTADSSGNKRSPPVKLGRRIQGHLRRWKRLDGDAESVCRFAGLFPAGGAAPAADPHGSWRKVVKAAGLEGVTRHTLRHTRATWMAQKGVPLFQAAGFLGMTVKTLEKTYAHHHPDWQEEAANI